MVYVGWLPAAKQHKAWVFASLRETQYLEYCDCVLFQGEVNIMFIKMEEPKDFVTWLQVAKVRIEKHVSTFCRSKIWNCNFDLIFFISVL